MEENFNIYGIRSIIEAINNNEEIDKIWLLKGLKSTLFDQLFSLIKSQNISYSFVPKEALERFSKKNYQGAVARISPIKILDFENHLDLILEKNKKPIIILLDGITDARNFGAIIRTASATKVDAIVIPSNGNAPINADVVKTSAGGVFKVPITKVSHIKDAVFLLQSNLIEVIALTEKSEQLIYNYDLKKPIAIIMGSEDKGISPGILKLVKKASLPMDEKTNSLNVSVACGAVLYEITRQRL